LRAVAHFVRPESSLLIPVNMAGNISAHEAESHPISNRSGL
jgi:hypothetical protein